jgi:UDP-N-acetylmuramoyl-tripeptide--D-alanyl-D-alanine ligase
MVIIDVVIFVCVYLYGGVERLCGISIIVVSIQWFLNIVANVINHPIEKTIGNYYINDAKKIIKSRPDLTIIGITGSYGKTSVKYYLQTLLQGKYSVLVTPGNFNTTFGVTRTIREHLKPEHEIFLCEMGARRVNDIKEICDIVHPKYGIVSSIGPQHLDTFFNMENIKKTKFELIDALPDDGIAFLNGDNEYILDQAKSYNNTVFYHGEKTGSGYYAKDITLSQMGTQFTVVAPNGEEEQFQMRLVGGHNIVNVVGAISVAHTLGISLKDLKVPVRRLEPVEHRMQIRHQGLATIIDDAYNSNPVGSKAAVETLAMFDGARILITPGMVELGEKEKEFNFAFGTYAAECCDYILLVHEEHSRPIKDGALSKGFPEDKLFVFSKVQDAISFAYSIKDDREKFILLENDLPDNY